MTPEEICGEKQGAFEDDLQDAEERIQAVRRSFSRGEEDRSTEAEDDPAPIPSPFMPRAKRRRGEQVSSSGNRTEKGALLATLGWCLLSLGVGAIACGGVLLGWSLWSSRPELWNFGLPILLGGQAAFFVGIVLQMEGLSVGDSSRVSTADRPAEDASHDAPSRSSKSLMPHETRTDRRPEKSASDELPAAAAARARLDRLARTISARG